MQAHHVEFLELLNGQVQYVVPRWQRRYRWGQSDIERLVEDLVTVASAGPDAAHYGGTLLTFPEPGPPGVVKTIRVVDGQQRLTTVSILLACIANRLAPEGRCGDWTAEIIRDDRLTNPGKRKERHRKLRLQDRDEEEYRRVLEGNPTGSGAVTQAWRTLRRLVARLDPSLLLTGLERLRVVSIGLGDREDPQQIFESLNATGRPLTESEKVKNWLLMGLPDEAQQDLYENHWVKIERTLGAEHTTEPTDTFLRDVLRWRTGESTGIERVYDGLRRWIVKQGNSKDRPALCRDLARLAELYGILTGAAGQHPDSRVERELRHLRAMRIDVHRPLSLRLLNDASGNGDARLTHEAIAKILAGIGTWTTRLWLADRPTAGMNTAVAELAHGPGPSDGEDATEYWLGRIHRLRNTRVGVPHDEAVREGIRTRKAYGGSATRSSFAVLCALMEAEELRGEAPARTQLTIEHVMPQKLTEVWKRALGEEAEEIHGRYRDRLANLTLSGDATNASMAADPFDEKREVYRNSTMKLTRRLADENEWNEDSLERRAEDLACRVLNRWPWSESAGSDEQPQGDSATLRWRLEGGPWRTEHTASQMVLNVAGALLSRDPENAKRLSGEAIQSNVHPASRYPGVGAHSLRLRAIPGHDQYLMYPYAQDYPASAVRCRRMGERCQVQVEVEFEEDLRTQAFWLLLKKHTGGVPGQKDTWRGPNQWTSPVNLSGDRIGFYVGNPDHLRLYIRAGETQASEGRAARMRQYSWMIREQMGDQETGGNLEKSSLQGTTVYVRRRWERPDEARWPEAAQWIKEQYERLRAILIDPPVENNGTAGTVPTDSRTMASAAPDAHGGLGGSAVSGTVTRWH